jgi:XisH protein
MYIDLGAESIVAAERAGQKIAVEIKSFLGASSISEFHTALGQFFNYRLALEEKEPDRILYLAIPLITYEEFFTLQFIPKAVKRAELKLLVYIENTEVISQWIP